MEYNSSQQQSQLPNTDPIIPKNPTPSHPLPRHIPKKSALIIFFTLAIIFLAGGAYGIYNLGKNSATPTPKPTAMKKTPTPTPDPTTNWQTYDGNGFMFKYPPQYLIQDPVFSVTLWSLNLNGEVIPGQMQLFQDSGNFNVPKSGTFSNPAFFPALEKNKIIESYEETFVNSKKITKIVYSCGVDCQYHAITFNNGNTNVLFEMNTAGGNLSNIFNQILSTFKFTDTNSDNNKITFETFQKIKFYMYAPSGSTVNGENVTVNGSTFNVVSAGGRDGPCNYDEYGKTCTSEDIDVPNLPTGLKINTLRIWKKNGEVFMINPQSIYIKDEFVTDSLLITKTSPNTNFTPEETALWINLLKTINNE